MYCRSGEVKPAVFRSDRFCQINGQWYFVTREKTQEGPYSDRVEANAGATAYVERMQSKSRQTIQYM